MARTAERLRISTVPLRRGGRECVRGECRLPQTHATHNNPLHCGAIEIPAKRDWNCNLRSLVWLAPKTAA